VQEHGSVTTFLFTDIEGSTRLWERQPDRMQAALACHDALARHAVEAHSGIVVKTTGDGIHAAFGDPLDGACAALDLQQALLDPGATGGVALTIRCGLHAGVVERRDADYFGNAVNRAARIMTAAHGGQVLVSQAVADLVRARLPAPIGLRDLGLVRLRDLSSPERIYQLVHPRLRSDFPTLRSLEATPNNLPLQTSSFIGRERELADVKSLLRRERLVTLTGTGGLGKSRLSLQVAADALDDYHDGVWLVELAALTDPRMVAQAVASVLGVKEAGGVSVQQAIAEQCRDRTLLLILDNCEHLIGACAELAAYLLRSVRGVKILASSRERLNIGSEATYPLAPFAIPDPTESLATLAKTDGVRLFIERAIAAQPSFALTSHNAGAVAGICSRLDGIPLAIELAAARVRAMTIDTIATRLVDRFKLLTGGSRAALSRQQTLRGLIDWSYDLLSEPERALFRRLAVFAGGFLLEAAEAVAADDALPQADIFDLLAALVEKSLVTLDDNGGRYRQLETIRQYAAERLDTFGETRTIRNRHLAYYVELTETARAELSGPQQGEWLARLDGERENLLAAHAWCEHADEGAELGLRLIHSTKSYWLTRGLTSLGYRLASETLGRSQAREPNLFRCRALYAVGQIGCFVGRYTEARAYLEESLAIARVLGDRDRIASVLQPLGLACLGLGDARAAREHLAEALELARAHGDRHDLTAALNAMAQLHRTQRELAKAVTLYEQVLTLAREVGDQESAAIGLLNLAMAKIDANDDADAPAYLLEAHAIAEQIGSRPVGQSVLEVSAGLASSRGRFDETARLFGAAEAQARTTGLHRDPADEAFLAPRIDAARRALGPAFEAVSAKASGLDYAAAMNEVRDWLLARQRDAAAAPAGTSGS
jgi:predicted ATPase/class 3 adenylate cyclase